jgi:hypothetical protein
MGRGIAPHWPTIYIASSFSYSGPVHTMVCAQTDKTRRHVEQIMSDTTPTPQQGAGTQPSGQKSGPQQQGQQPPATPQQQSGTVIRGPIFKDWASI